MKYTIFLVRLILVYIATEIVLLWTLPKGIGTWYNGGPFMWYNACATRIGCVTHACDTRQSSATVTQSRSHGAY